MGKADCGFRLVHVLPTSAAGAIRVNANLIPVECYLCIIFNFGNHFKHGERGLPTFLSVEWRDANKSMHTAFRAKPTEGIPSANLQDNAAVAGTFTFGGVNNLGRKTVSLRPAHVRPQQDRGPVTRFGSTCASLNRDDCIGVGVLTAKEQ